MLGIISNQKVQNPLHYICCTRVSALTENVYGTDIMRTEEEI